MILEPDSAVLKHLAGGRVAQTCEGLDALQGWPLALAINDCRLQSPRWVFVVTLTTTRPFDWWLRAFMFQFRNGISAVKLSDGQQAFCTWEAG